MASRGRRKASEWNSQRRGVHAAVFEQHDLVNRLCEPEALDREVNALVEVMLAKNPATLQVTKYFLDKGADLDLANSMIFEVAPPRHIRQAGCCRLRREGLTRSAAQAGHGLLARVNHIGGQPRSPPLASLRQLASPQVSEPVGSKRSFRT